jgi:hypothetical protein
MAIPVPDNRKHFALLSVGLDPPGDDLQTGLVRRTPTYDESSIDADDPMIIRSAGLSAFRFSAISS